ncbi:MAG: hypothetical protein WD737_00945 [Gemmatimonadota bacterium]
MSDNLPDRETPPGAPPERVLSTRDFEMVIRRAAELQAREAEESGAQEMTDAEAVKIGRELGLSTRHLQQALAEVASSHREESGLFVKLFGPANVHAGRTVRGDHAEVSRRFERYLVEREYLAVLRRFSDRVVFTRATGVVAAVGRVSSQIFSRSPLLKVSNLELSVSPLEDGYSYVTLATSLGGHRAGTAAVSILGGGSGATVMGAIFGIAIAPPAAVIGLPILGASIYGGHFYYEGFVRNVQVQFESLLDRLEHGELPPPVTRWSSPGR